ncbi:gluconate kinase [Lentzea sp. NBRC 105346]|uniref:gluconokinase n=1 Tax=Lentzea sp. NBRC 105346 TaxID=3032205 RepID=UPI0024A4009B|nr:gluconokinase [Lentzea sp. NBRC 105346]GLZ32451.1 gluconate kinase [Lentzea sp. NBRC 105346]
MTEVVLGVDLGTTATKVIAVDRRAKVVASAEREYSMRTMSEGHATHDPSRVLDAAFQALAEVAASGTVRALSLTGAMHTLLGLNDGEPVTESLSWADNRAVEQTERLRGTARGKALHQATGTPIHSMSPLTKLAWFAEHGFTAQKWCGLKDFVHRELTGRFTTEHSSGSGTGLMDIRRLEWHPDALDFAQISADQLPELEAPTAHSPLTAEIPGLPKGLPVVAGGGDGPMGNLGVGAVVPGVGAVSLGTSGALRVAQEGPGVDDECRTFCYAIGDGLWARGGAISNGGVVAQWAAETFGVDVGELLTRAGEVPVGAQGIVALPYLLGERAPWWDPTARAALLGFRREHGPAEITRALVEGVCQQLATVLDAVPHVDSVRVTGGAFRSPLWAEVLAAAFGLPLEITEDSEGSAVGAALLAWRALGELESLTAAADIVVPTRRITPDPDKVAYYARKRPLVQRAYGALKDLWEDQRP